jgi:hypothetical protein
VITVSRTSISLLNSHCFFVGNCIGKRNHKPFVLFLLFGLLKSLLGLLCSVYTTIHVLVIYEIYNKANFSWYCFAFVLLLAIVIAHRHFKCDSSFNNTLYAITAVAFCFLLVKFNNFEYKYCQYFVLHGIGCALYLAPTVMFYVHFRTQVILIYRKVSLEDDF